MSLMGFVQTGVVFKTRRQANQSALRSPDPYELTSPKESFAVNLEYFALDPEFACRRPAVHQYYAAQFGEDPHMDRKCRTRTLLALNTALAGARPIFADLQPSRIYQIHALLAGKGPQAMSRWGHSLFRLVICAPDRIEAGPECMDDIAHHVAISFRSNVPDAAISYKKGIMGGYSSLLFAQPFLGVIEEYNKGEFRELLSLPLTLNENQKIAFLGRVLESSWEYAGRYRFITNNCAVEALNFLKGVISDASLQKIHSLTPTGLFEKLQGSGLVDASPLEDLEKASRSGHYFASKKPEIEAAYQAIRKSAGGLSPHVEDYLDRTSAAERPKIYNEIYSALQAGGDGSDRASQARGMASRFFLLESYVIRRAEKSYSQRIAMILEGERWDAIPRETRSSAPRIRDLIQRLRTLQQQALPQQIRASGYGIPLEETDQSQADPDQSRSGDGALDEQRQIIQQIVDWASQAFAPLHEELKQAQANRVFFLKEMRKHPL